MEEGFPEKEVHEGRVGISQATEKGILGDWLGKGGFVTKGNSKETPGPAPWGAL